MHREYDLTLIAWTLSVLGCVCVDYQSVRFMPEQTDFNAGDLCLLNRSWWTERCPWLAWFDWSWWPARCQGRRRHWRPTWSTGPTWYVLLLTYLCWTPLLNFCLLDNFLVRKSKNTKWRMEISIWEEFWSRIAILCTRTCKQWTCGAADGHTIAPVSHLVVFILQCRILRPTEGRRLSWCEHTVG